MRLTSDIRVLILTGVLPVKSIEGKEDENDIILVTEDNFRKYYPNTDFHYVFFLPFSNKIISLFSKKWKSYYDVIKSETIDVRGRVVNTLGLLMLPYRLNIQSFLFFLSYINKKKYLEKIVTEFRPTIIHAQSTQGEAYIARRLSKRFGIPYVVTVRQLGQFNAFTKRNLKVADKIITISQTDNKRIGLEFPEKTIQIPHGIDEAFFINKNDKRHNVPLRIISVCRLIPLKNIDLVISVLSQLDFDYVYHIYGRGPEKDRLETIIRDLGLSKKIKLKGYINNEELVSLFGTYDVFVMVSRRETLGRVYLEAMAAGLPVIATKGTGIDGIIMDRREGMLIDLANPFHLNEVLLEILSNPMILDQLGLNAKNLATQFSWKSIVKKIYDVYQKS